MARETIASMAVNIGLDLSEFTKSSNEFNKSFGKLGGQLQKVGTGIAGAFGGAAAGIGLALGSAVKVASDFDTQMSKVAAIAGASATDLGKMRQAALDLGASTSKSASEVATGMEEMAAKGFNASQVIQAMPGIIDAATASGSDMAQTADVMSSALNIFGLKASDASKVADILAKTANISAADMTDMQYALKYAGPPAAALGVSMEELSASIGIMTNAGMKGEQAGTTLRGALLGLLSPSEDNSKLMSAMGVAITDTSGNFVGISQLVQNLNTSMADMTQTQKAATLAQLVGKESVSGMLDLMAAGPEKIDSMTKSLEDSGGSSKAAADIMRNNLAGSMDQLSGAVETLQIGFGEALIPAIRGVADMLSGLVNWFNNLPGPMKEMIAIGAVVVAGLFAMIAVVGILVAALGVLVAAEWAVILPIVGIVAAIAGVMIVIAALAALIYANWDSISAATTTAWNAITSALTTAWDAIVAVFKAAWAVIQPVVTSAWAAITAAFNAALNTIKTVLSAAWEAIKTIFAAAFLVVVALVTGNWDDIGGIFSAAGAKLKSIVSGAWEAIKKIWSDAFAVIGKKAGDAWEGMKKIFADAWAGIKSWFTGVVSDAEDMGSNIIKGMIDGVKSMASNLASAAMSVVKSAIDAAKNVLGIHSPSKVFMEIGGYTGEGLAIGLSKSAAGVVNATKDLAMAPVGAYQDALSFPTSSGSGAVSSTDRGGTVNVTVDLDGRTIAKAVGQPLVDMIRLKTGVRI